MRAQRDVWGQTLVELGASDLRIMVVDGDLANSTKADLFADAFPDRFIEVGIAEQNMVAIAFGLSTFGFRPWLSSFGVFLTHRALDPVRMLASQTGAPLRIAGAYSGLLNGSSGKTHQDIEDFAIMRAMPGMTVLAPADEFEIAAATRWAADHDGPVYIRVARDAVAPVYAAPVDFEVGRVIRLRDGDAATVVSTGVQTSRVMDAAHLLERDGIYIRVVHAPTLKPLNEESLLEELTESPVITVEEHSVIGGLGGLVAETITTHAPRSVQRIGLADHWSESGPSDFLLDKYGLSAERVAERIPKILGRTA